MAAAGSQDVNELFHKMGEKLGWFQHKDLGAALKSLSKSAKKSGRKPRTDGSQPKEGRKKTHSAKTTKVKKKAHKDDGENHHIPVKRTLAHTNLPKTLGLTDACTSGNSYTSDSHDEGKRGGHKKFIGVLDFSSSDDDVDGNDIAVKDCKIEPVLSDSEINEVKTNEECGRNIFGGDTLKNLSCETTDKGLAYHEHVEDSQRLEMTDSFDEKVEMQDTYVSCVGESYVEQKSTSKERKDENKEDCIKPDYKEILDCKVAGRMSAFCDNDTIVQKPARVSADSFSPDIDTTFGEPQGESTRIHRRSSVSYRKLIGSSEDLVGSPEDLDSSGMSSSKHYKTCVGNTSTDDLFDMSEESENPLMETALEDNANDPAKRSFTDRNLKCHKEGTNTNNSAKNGSNDLCRELESLNIDLESQCNSTTGNSHTEETLETLNGNERKTSAQEFESTTYEECSGESIEVIDACVQTDNSVTEINSSPLKYSVCKENYSFIKNSTELDRYKSENSDDCLSQNNSDLHSDISEIEVRDISIQTDTYVDTGMQQSNINGLEEDTNNMAVNSDLSSSKSNDQTKGDHQLNTEIDQVTNDHSGTSENRCGSTSFSESKLTESDKSEALTEDEEDSVFKEEDSSFRGNVSGGDVGAEKVTSPSISCEDSSIVSGDSSVSNASCTVSDRPEKKLPFESHSTCDISETKHNTQNTWRSKKLSLSSSDDDDLEAYFEKLRNPPKKSSSSEHSPIRMEDFIVDDDEMSSDSDDSAFYIKETRKLQDKAQVQRIKNYKATNEDNPTDSDDSDFSSDKYPGSVSKHKRQTTKAKTRSKSWSLSSDEEDVAIVDNTAKCYKTTSAKGDKEEMYQKQDKFMKIDIQDDNDNTRGKSGKFVSNMLPDSDEETLFKTPKPLKKVTKNKSNKENQPQGKFKASKCSNNMLHNPEGSQKKESRKIIKSESRVITFSDSDDDDDDDNTDKSAQLPHWKTSVLKEISENPKPKSRSLCDEEEVLGRTPSSVLKGSQPKFFTPQPVRPRYGFLKSLTLDLKDSLRDPEAARFVTGFKKKKEELSQHLFQLYNQSVFENKLPADLPIEWNKRLLRTAGYCAYKRNSRNPEDRSVRIELSTKVCDSAERVRDTLIHELCHAAVWLLNGTKEGHGRFWKYWARKSNHAHPDIPVIARCHDYNINTKFTYQCTQCGYSIGRHSKSLDTEKKVCGYCHGQFQLLQNSSSFSSSRVDPVTPKTPRTPNRFALYVKEHYNAVKKKDKTMKHGEVMKELSKQFAEMNKI